MGSSPNDQLSDISLRTIALLPSTIASIVGSLCVLLFLGSAYSFDARLFKPTHIKLLVLLSTSNLLCMTSLLGGYAAAGSVVQCSVVGYFVIGGFAGDYAAGFCICVVLFRTLVLYKPELTRFQERCFLLTPVVFFLAYGSVTIGSFGKAADDSCWFQNSESIASTVASVSAGIFFLADLLLVLWTGYKLAQRAKENGKMLNRDSLTRVTRKLTWRMIMYPIAMLVTGGTGIVTMFMTSNIYVTGFIGLFAVSIAGFLNALVFFAIDLNVRTMSAKIAKKLRSSDSDRTSFLIRIYALLARTKDVDQVGDTTDHSQPSAAARSSGMLPMRGERAESQSVIGLPLSAAGGGSFGSRYLLERDHGGRVIA